VEVLDVQPRTIEPGLLGSQCGEADPVEAERQPVADEADDLVVGDTGAVNPQPLEEEAADAEREQRPDEDVVFGGGVAAPEAVVTDPVASVHGHSDADDEQQAHRVDDERVGEIEVAFPERHVEDFLEGVLIDHDDQGRDEQRQESPHDKRVHQSAVEVPVELLLVREHGSGRAHDSVSEVIDPRERIVVPSA